MVRLAEYDAVVLVLLTFKDDEKEGAKLGWSARFLSLSSGPRAGWPDIMGMLRSTCVLKRKRLEVAVKTGSLADQSLRDMV